MLTHKFVSSRITKWDNDVEEFNTLSISRLIAHISKWIQSLLITSEKNIRAGDKDSKVSKFVLDCRCWEILRYCLKESERMCVPLSLKESQVVESSRASETPHLSKFSNSTTEKNHTTV